MLNSAEHEICPANKSQIINNSKFFLAKHSWAWKFLANEYENVNYSYLLAKPNFMLSWVELYKKFYNIGLVHFIYYYVL